jgi:hypothetical protein
VAAGAAFAIASASAADARAQQQEPESARETLSEGTTSAKTLAERIMAPPPVPPTQRAFIQYGVAITNELVAAPGEICSSAPNAPCIFGSGGGFAVRVGVRTRGTYYLGGAYELSKLDPSQLYRLAIWQQVRGEGRYYINTGLVTAPYLMAGIGASGYGNEWSIDTFGPSLSAGAGGELEVSPTTTLGLALTYRAVYFTKFTDSAGTPREPGVAHVLALDFSLEARDPL